MQVHDLGDVPDGPVGRPGEGGLAERAGRRDGVRLAVVEVFQGGAGHVLPLGETQAEGTEGTAAADAFRAVLLRFREPDDLRKELAGLLVQLAAAAEFAGIMVCIADVVVLNL